MKTTPHRTFKKGFLPTHLYARFTGDYRVPQEPIRRDSEPYMRKTVRRLEILFNTRIRNLPSFLAYTARAFQKNLIIPEQYEAVKDWVRAGKAFPGRAA